MHEKKSPGRPKNTPIVLWSKVEKREPNECWPWIGFRNNQGYGRTWINGNGYYAHRVIFDLANPGIIELSAPKSMDETGFVLHRCDNPCCCNPGHLFLGSHDDNMEDKRQKGRCPDYSGDKAPRAKLTMEIAKEIRRVSKYGISSGALASLFEISKPVIKSIIAGRSYVER